MFAVRHVGKVTRYGEELVNPSSVRRFSGRLSDARLCERSKQRIEGVYR
jgi:hypothetical protein